MIKLVAIDGFAVPKIFCDSCGGEILDAKQGAIVFRNFMKNSQSTEVIYVHKNFISESCMAEAEELIRSTGENSGWIELSEHIGSLATNLGMTRKSIGKYLTK